MQNNYYLSEIIRVKVFLHGKKIGRLKDLVISETDKIPDVSHFVVHRSFGYPMLLIPWENVKEVNGKKIIIEIEDIEKYEHDPAEGQILLKDHIMDKKVLDFDGNEVEVVYDVRLNLLRGKLYVSDVDCSKYGLLKRLGLKWLANFISKVADSVKEEPLSWSYIQPLEHLSSFKGNVKLKVLKEKLPEIHPVDLADILEELDHDQRLAVFNQLDTEQASDTLEEVEPRVQRDLISSIDVKRAAEIINDMTPAQAADVLAILPGDDADNIMTMLDAETVSKLQFLLDRHEEKVINYATNHYLSFTPDTIVQDVFAKFREIAKDKDIIMYIYVVDVDSRILGVLDIKDLLQSEVTETLESIMTTHVISLKEDDTVSSAVEMFDRYDFRAIPIANDEDVILGVVPYRDIMDLKHYFN